MTFDEISAQLNKRVFKKGINYSLDTFKNTLNELGNPHLDLQNVIHIAGTNGKGSTLTFLAHALQKMGYSVGTYTSPHLFSYTERISINGHPISNDDFCSYYQTIIQKADIQTEFEILTIMAFMYFKDKNPNYIIIETGVGGRLDATNVVTPIASVITQIDFDHMAILGNTIEKIASEKAGIIKNNIPIFCQDQAANVISLISNVAKSKNAALYIAPPIDASSNMYLNTPYQNKNLGTSFAVLKELFPNKTSADIRAALKNACIPCRFEKVMVDRQTIILDAAHNLNGITELHHSVIALSPTPITTIFGLLNTKDADAMTPTLASFTSPLYYCEFSKSAHSLKTIQAIDSTISPFKLGDPLPTTSPLLITGSIHFLGDFLTHYPHINKKRTSIQS